MRATGKDIIEYFGYAPDDTSYNALESFRTKVCPFVGSTCSKINSDQTVIYGVCSVSQGVQKASGSEVIICPKRLYADQFKALQNVAREVWGDIPLIAYGTHSELYQKALAEKTSVIAFGQNSGSEISVPGIASLSMDWVLQRYTSDGKNLTTVDFVGIEVQSIDITGNYRQCHAAYEGLKRGNDEIESIPNSGHGLNWANVHKRLIPQIIHKGSLYREIERCKGFYFILPEAVFQKFENVLPDLDKKTNNERENLSVHTYHLGGSVATGQIRDLKKVRSVHYSLDSVIHSFSHNSYKEASNALDEKLKNLL